MRSVLNEAGFADVFAQFAQQATNKAAEKSKTNKNYYIGGSISKYTKGLLMSFPVLCDDSLSLDTAMNVSKANEKNITSMMEMLFASMSINGKQGMTGKDVVSIFHKNIDTMPIDDYIDMADDYVRDYLASEAGELLPRVKDSYVREAARDFVDELKLPKKTFPINSFSGSSINDYMTMEHSGKVTVYEYNSSSATPYNPDIDVTDREKFKHQVANDNIKNNPDNLRYQKDRDAANNAKDLRDNPIDARYQNGTNRQNLYSANQFNQKRILDSDFKKANELQPTLLVVNFNIINDSGEVIDRSSFVAGIKCRLIATSGLDIAERLISVNRQKLTFKNLIRATTGETSFCKDFLLAIKQQKIDAKNDAKRGEAAKLWNTLKKRAVGNTYRKMSRDGNDASAITTLVISQDIVNYLKSTNKIDVLNPATAKKIMDSYNLLCLVVADDANEVANFLYDGNKNFERLAYSVLSKEANDKALRRELNLINQSKRY